MFAGRDERGDPVQISRTVRGGKRDAERVAAQLTLKPAAKAGRKTVADVLEAWQAAKWATWAPYTRRDHASRVRQISQDRLASIPVARLEVADVDAWIARRRALGKGHGAIHDQLQTLRTALWQAVRWGWITYNPAALANDDRPKRTRRGVMSAEDVQRALAVAGKVHQMAPVAIRLAAITGARRGELSALRWEDLDGDFLVIDSALTVDHEGEGDERHPVIRDDPTKTGDRREVALDAETVAMLAELREQREVLGPWLFSETAKPPHPGRVSWWWKRTRELAGVDPQWRLHDLRHWSATWALGEDYDVAMVAGRLGHSDGSTTLRVYAHARARRDVDLAASLGEALRPSDT